MPGHAAADGNADTMDQLSSRKLGDVLLNIVTNQERNAVVGSLNPGCLRLKLEHVEELRVLENQRFDRGRVDDSYAQLREYFARSLLDQIVVLPVFR